MPPQRHHCYLLRSRHRPARTYVGYTVAPARRLRQHNGELQGGARATRALRPWVHVAIVHGFPSARAALQFEWAWKHPRESRHLSAAVRGQSVNGPLGRLWVLNLMVRTAPWAALDLVVERCEGATLPPGRVPPTVPLLRRASGQMHAIMTAAGANARADLAPYAELLRGMLDEYDAAPPPRQAEMRAQLRYEAEARREERYVRARAQSAAAVPPPRDDGTDAPAPPD